MDNKQCSLTSRRRKGVYSVSLVKAGKRGGELDFFDIEHSPLLSILHRRLRSHIQRAGRPAPKPGGKEGEARGGTGSSLADGA